MALTINTNITSLVTQSNLAKATSSLNKAIERMTTGYKINHASDNAAGYSIAKNWQIKLSSLDAAADNASMGSDLLATLEDNYDLISSHLQRVRDLTEQAANGTYSSASKKAIQSEITARLEEIDRISTNAEYNGIKLMKGTGSEIKLQVGTDASTNSQITLAASLTKGADTASLFAGSAVTLIADVAKACAGNDIAHTATSMLTNIDNVIKNVSERVTAIGAAQIFPVLSFHRADRLRAGGRLAVQRFGQRAERLAPGGRGEKADARLGGFVRPALAAQKHFLSDLRREMLSAGLSRPQPLLRNRYAGGSGQV